MSLFEKDYQNQPNTIFMLFIYVETWIQGLTQTLMSSGPQDHQLRGSGGSTILLAFLTTTTTLVNLQTKFLDINYVWLKSISHKRWHKVQGRWSISTSRIHVSHDYEQVFCSAKMVRAVVFHILFLVSGEYCLHFWGILQFLLGLDILGVHRTTGY